VAKKSVIEIDVNDAKFKAFADAFNKFQDAVGDVNKEMKNLGKGTTEVAEKGVKGFAKFRQELAAIQRSAKDTISPFVKIASVTTQIASSVAGATFNLAKWAAFGAVGTGFGLGALASAVVGTRREALGYGVSSGALRASRTAYGQFADADELLGNIASSQFDPTKASAYSVLGIRNQSKKSPVQLEGEILSVIGEFFKRNKQNPAALELVAPLANREQMQRMAGLDPGELKKAIENQSRLQAQYEKSDKGFRSFYQALQEAEQTIETSLIGGMDKLAPHLAKLSNTIAKIIQDFLDSPRFEQLMVKLGSQLERFIGYLTTPEFESDLGRLKTLVFDLADAMAAALSLIKPFVKLVPHIGSSVAKSNPFTAALYFEKKAFDIMTKPLTGVHGFDMRGSFSGSSTADWLMRPMAERLHNPGNLKIPGHSGSRPEDFQQFANDNAGLLAMKSQLGLYYNRDKLDTISSIVSKYAPRSENDTSAYIASVAKRSGFGAAQHLNLSDSSTMASLISAMTKQENSRSGFTPQQVKIVIDNNTSSNVNSSAAALPAGVAR